MKIFSAFFLLLSTVIVSAVAAQTPDLSGFWTVQFGADINASPLLEQIPSDAVFVDDAGGGELAEGEYGGLELTQKALDEIASYDFDIEFSVAYSCIPPTAVFYMQAPFPMEIHQGQDMIVFQMEYFDMVRIIHMDGRDHPGDDYPHSKNGHSIGHWEGNELVVDSTHFSEGTFMNNGYNHSEDIHMVERFRLSDEGNGGQILSLLQIAEDPAVFKGKAARFMAWRKVEGEHVYPYDCDPSFGR